MQLKDFDFTCVRTLISCVFFKTDFSMSQVNVEKITLGYEHTPPHFIKVVFLRQIIFFEHEIKIAKNIFLLSQ